MSLNKTGIDWVKNPDGTQGYTWNPITGCLNGCEYCYARRLANTRLKATYLANKNIPKPSYVQMPFYHKFLKDPFYPRFWEDRLFLDMGTGKPKGIFVCDMSDLFGIGIPEEWTQKVLRQIAIRPNNRFYLLTKQPQNLIKFSPFPDNCWVGVSATGFSMASQALYVGLDRIEAKVKFISYEPLLEDVNVKSEDFINTGIKWVIIGAQTKPTVMPKIEWVKEIVEACDKAGIPVFLKDNLEPLLSSDVRNANSIFYDQTEPMSPKLRQELPSG